MIYALLLLLLKNSYSIDHGTPLIQSTPQSRLQPILTQLGYTDWNEAQLHVSTQLPTYTQFIRQTWTVFGELGGTWNCTPQMATHEPPLLAPYRNFFGAVNGAFFAVGFGISLILNLIRALVTPQLRDRALRAGLSPADAEKLPESLWKGTLHAVLWCCTCYVVILSGRHRFFHQPCEVWSGIAWNQRIYIDPPAFDLQFIYWIQLAYYLHAIYASLWLDSRRADWQASLVHHGITISLLSLSFIRRFLPIGVLVLFMHDSSDVLLEFTKVNVYCKTRHGRRHRLNEYLSNIGFAVFAINWFQFRLYWYPLKVLNACNWCIFLNFGCPDQRLFVTFNVLLWALQFLHLYWFTFILLLIYRIATGKQPSVTDVREVDLEPEGKADGIVERNGHVTGDPIVPTGAHSHHTQNGQFNSSVAKTTRRLKD